MSAKKKATRKSSRPMAARPTKKDARLAKEATKTKAATLAESSAVPAVPFPVVGIGASAGGLEAFTEFFRAMRTPCGMAFVVVSHLDPDHKSALTEILSNTTSMPVGEVSDGDTLQPDRVYVIPPNTNIVVEGDVLRLAPRSATRGPHMSIDVFLRSLAVAWKSRAVGVILSGTASDGTLGLKAIKGEGGITFAQDETAKHNGMPRSAINAGCVDFILPPARIAAELSRLGAHPYLNGGLREAPSAAPPEKSSDDFGTVLKLLSAAVGVDFTHYKPPTLRRRIERRMVLRKQQTLNEYAQLLQDDPAELQALCQEVLIQVTGFFRDPEMFVALRETVFPKLVEDRPADAPLRIWVPGCSTGEEVYSLAICLLEFLAEQGLQTPIKIFATDIASRAIEIARAGEYLESIAADVSPDRLRRFFVKTDGRYQIQKPVRDLCVFARQDVTKDPPFSQIDLVSCRNLLIYLGPVLQYRVLPIFHYALRPNGFLVLGESESVGGFTELFDPFDKAHRFYRRKETPRRLTFDFAPGRASTTGLTSLELVDDPGRRLLDVQREADRVVLAKYAPAGVVVDDNLQIVQFRGHTGLYLEPAPGTPNLDLLQMAREGLMVDLRKAIDQAKRDGVPQRRERVLVKTNGESQEITLEVLPILIPASGKRFFVVLFARSVAEETSHTSFNPNASGVGAKGIDERQTPRRAHAVGVGVKQTIAELAARELEIERLQQELDATKGYLQSVIEAQEAANEELKAANEEIVSSNEELQSTNEELETAKEELQATNEELTTVNDELQSRIAIAAQLSDDLSNLIDAVNIPTVVLGHDLHIRRFSPSAQRVLNLIPTDVGRHIGDFKLKINVPDLEPLVQQVLDTLEVRQQEVQDEARRWHKLIVRPYKTLDNKIDGAIITLSDIDALKRREQELQDARDYALGIVETVRNPLLVLDGDLRVLQANRAFYETFRVTPAETERQLVYLLGNGQWNIPRLRQLLEEILPQNSHFDDFDVEHMFPEIGRRSMILNARRVQFDGERPPHILLSIEDVTDRLKATEALRESRERIAAIVNTAAEGIITIGEDGLIDFINPAALRMFGYAADELLGKNIKILMPPPFHEEHDGYLANYLRTGLKRVIGTTREVVGLRRDGTNFPISISISELHDGVQRLFTGIVRDITERKRLEKELLDIAALEQQRIGQDLHDSTGQELTGLGFLAQELAESLVGTLPTAAAAARKIVEGLDRALKQVRQVAKGLIPVDVSAEGLMVALREMTDKVTAQTQVPCRFVCSESVLVNDNQTATHLYRIAQEAVTNALKHSQAHHITVSLTQRPDELMLSIHDDGTGITISAESSAGMGLKIMRYRASLIGANLTIEPAKGYGTLVTCTVRPGSQP